MTGVQTCALPIFFSAVYLWHPWFVSDPATFSHRKFDYSFLTKSVFFSSPVSPNDQKIDSITTYLIFGDFLEIYADLLLLPYGGRNLCVTARAVIIGTRCSFLIGLWVIVDYEIGRKLIHYPFLYFILIWALHTF